MEKIGFIGLGIMGNPMAGHLLAAGYSVVTTDHFVAAPKELVEKGLKTVKGNKAVAEAADIIITMVPTRRMWLTFCSMAITASPLA